MKIEVSLTKIHAFFIVTALLLLSGIIFVTAFGGGNPSVMGHSAGEIDLGDIFIGILQVSNNGQDHLRLGHGGSNAFLDVIGSGNLEFRHEGTNRLRLTDQGVLQVKPGSSWLGFCLEDGRNCPNLGGGETPDLGECRVCYQGGGGNCNSAGWGTERCTDWVSIGSNDNSGWGDGAQQFWQGELDCVRARFECRV